MSKPQCDEKVPVEERQLNYERYRVLVQNEFLGINEEKFLHQLQLEEQFGLTHSEEKSKKKSGSGGGAAIDFQYEDSYNKPFSQTISTIEATSTSSRYDDYAKDSSDSDLDLNLDMQKIGTDQAHGLNTYAHRYGMQSNDFYSFLTKDLDDAENLKLAQEEEHEKILYCGRKGRRERRAQRERRFHVKIDADAKPSYAKPDEGLPESENKQAETDSRSPSPEAAEKITYITSFGDEEETKKMSYSDKVKQNLGALKRLNEASRRNNARKRTYSSSDSSSDRYHRRDRKQKHYSSSRRQKRSRSKTKSLERVTKKEPEK